MKFMIQRTFVLLSLLFVSCNAVKVNYDYDKQANLTDYATYDYFSDMETGLSQLDEKRLLAILDATLKAKGYRLSETPEFLIDIKSGTFRSNNRSNVGVGLGGGGRSVGGGLSIGIPVGDSGVNRNILFEFVDANKNTLFWQADTNSNFKENASPEAREEQLRKVVVKVFEKYPSL